MWADLVSFVYKTTQSDSKSDQHKLRFGAMLCVHLMLQNRISLEPSTVKMYNDVIARYVSALFASENCGHEIKSKQIPFYIACLFGSQTQCEIYSRLML